jgi:hypothetical protein
VENHRPDVGGKREIKNKEEEPHMGERKGQHMGE